MKWTRQETQLWNLTDLMNGGLMASHTLRLDPFRNWKDGSKGLSSIGSVTPTKSLKCTHISSWKSRSMCRIKATVIAFFQNSLTLDHLSSIVKSVMRSISSIKSISKPLQKGNHSQHKPEINLSECIHSKSMKRMS